MGRDRENRKDKKMGRGSGRERKWIKKKRA